MGQGLSLSSASRGFETAKIRTQIPQTRSAVSIHRAALGALCVGRLPLGRMAGFAYGRNWPHPTLPSEGDTESVLIAQG